MAAKSKRAPRRKAAPPREPRAVDPQEALDSWLAVLRGVANSPPPISKRTGKADRQHIENHAILCLELLTLKSALQNGDITAVATGAMQAMALAMQVDSRAVGAPLEEQKAIAKEARKDGSSRKGKEGTAKIEKKVKRALKKLVKEDPDVATYSGDWPKKKVIKRLVERTKLSKRTISKHIPKKRPQVSAPT